MMLVFRGASRYLLVALISLVLASGCESTPPTLQVGMRFPALALTDFSGNTVQLSRLRGKVVVLNVWAPWCVPCVKEMPSLQRLSEQLDPERYAVIGLTVGDDRFLAEEFLARNALNFANYIDDDRTVVATTLGVKNFPQTFVLSPDGLLARRVVGWRDWSDASVIAALQQLYFAAAGVSRG